MLNAIRAGVLRTIIHVKEAERKAAHKAVTEGFAVVATIDKKLDNIQPPSPRWVSCFQSFSSVVSAEERSHIVDGGGKKWKSQSSSPS
jgi:hypothetical protein